jgi:hypothetical protein
MAASPTCHLRRVCRQHRSLHQGPASGRRDVPAGVGSAENAGGTTQISYSFPWADGAASQFTSPYGRAENTAAITGAVNAAQHR